MERGSRLRREIWAGVVLAIAFLVLISLLSYDPADWSFNAPSGNPQTHNWAGVVGAHLADIFLQSFGLLAYASPLLLFGIAYQLFRDRESSFGPGRCIGCALLLWSATILTSLLIPEVELDRLSGGIVGGLSRYLLVHLFGFVGSYLISLSMLTLGVMLALQVSLEDLYRRVTAKSAADKPRDQSVWAGAQVMEMQKLNIEHRKADKKREPVQQKFEFIDKDSK